MGLFRRTKNNNQPVISQILSLIPVWILASVVKTHKSDKFCHRYLTRDELVALMFGQLNKCSTLQDISTGIAVSETFIKDLGLKQSPARSTMSDGNKKRSWQVFESLYFKLLNHYRVVLEKKHRSHEIKEIEGKTVKIIDSTLINLCLAMFDWAKYRTAKGGIKIHTCWDESIMLPDMVNITEGKVSDRYGLAKMVFPKGTIIIEDRGYFDFSLMKHRIKSDNHFVTRIKCNTVFEKVKELPIDKSQNPNLFSDWIIRLNGDAAVDAGMHEEELRLVQVYDEEKDLMIDIITNNLEWSAATVAALYKLRWAIELFFKALKQNLQVKSFLGTSQNAVKSQIYVALITYLLLELIRRTVCKTHQAFSNFCEKIRICLTYYQTLDYVCNIVKQGAHAVRKKAVPHESLLTSQPDLFSG